MKNLEKEGLGEKKMGADKRFEIKNGLIHIPLGGRALGQYAIIDDTPQNRVLAELFFSLDGHGYPTTNINRRPIHLHHLIIGWPPAGSVVDHIDHDKLNSRKGNLRFVKRGENNYNTGLRRDNTTGVTGVYYEPHPRKGDPFWYSRISKNGILYELGHYKTFEDAVEARLAAERELYGYNVGHIHGVSAGNGSKNLRVLTASENRGRREKSRKRGSRRKRVS